MSEWKVEYQNDTGPNDDSYWEWWDVSNGKTNYKANTENDAVWLCELLNGIIKLIPALDKQA